MRVIIRSNWFGLAGRPRPLPVEPWVEERGAKLMETSYTVAQVRAALRAASGQYAGGGEGPASTALAGQIFHECANGIGANWATVLDDGRLASEEAAGYLSAHLYSTLLAPRLERHRAALADNGAEVLDLWVACQELCRWLVGALRAAKRAGVESVWRADLEMNCFVEGRGRRVHLRGEADALWYDAEGDRWCVLEFKLGRGWPELDLAQLCLYHLLLRGQGALCLLSFRPRLEQIVIGAEEVRAGQRKLIDFVLTMPGGEVERPVDEKYLDLGKRLVSTFRQLGVEVKLVGEPVVGPSFIRYSLMPTPRARVKSIAAMAIDVQVQMGLETTPVIQNDRGRIVADIARQDRETIELKDLAVDLRAMPAKGLPLLLGVDPRGKMQFVDLANAGSAHLLVAGTTGSGKSEWMRMAIASLLLRLGPDELRLVLVDPKRTAFMDFAESPLLWTKAALVFPDESPVEAMLDELVDEMDRRYKLFHEARVKDIDEWHAVGRGRLFRIVLFCDEYGDLVADRRRKAGILDRIKRLGQKARAAGIHMVLATQSPRREVVDGVIKANLPGRVCLKVASALESRIVLETGGAELLLGRGDLYYSAGGDLVRVQAPLADPETWTLVTSSSR